MADIFHKLDQRGVESVRVTYSGSGDEGFVNDVFIEPEDEHTDHTSLRSDIEDFIYAKLEAEVPGWEINEGSYGEAVFNITQRTVAFDHKNIIETTEAAPFVVEVPA